MGQLYSKPSPEEAEHLKSSFVSHCAAAANAIHSADVLILVTGAGFSADSGLAVYNDVANIPAYRNRGLKYDDICDPEWLYKKPDLFYGFWGQCFNDYRQTRPHEGYDIVARWRDKKNASAVAKEMRRRQNAVTEADAISITEPYNVGGQAGAFFTFTSNVDAHSFDVFDANEIRECHGNVELWQCSFKQCDNLIWRAPLDHKFSINPETMLLEHQNNSRDMTRNVSGVKEKIDEKDDNVAHVGQILSSGIRENILKHMKSVKNDVKWAFDKSSDGNYPMCPKCKHLARPAILMYYDQNWIDNSAQESRWQRWKKTLFELTENRSSKNPLKTCIIEVGCGINVSTCRVLSDTSLDELKELGGDVTLIRINPDYPLGLDEKNKENTISIMAKGLESIKVIDKCLEEIAEHKSGN